MLGQESKEVRDDHQVSRKEIQVDGDDVCGRRQEE